MKKLLKEKINFFCDPKNALCILEKVCFYFGVVSIPSSLFIMFIFGAPCNANAGYNQNLALFVGLWAPTLIGIANYLKRPKKS